MRIICTTTVIAMLFVAAPGVSYAGSPFDVIPVVKTTNGVGLVQVAFAVPPNHFLYLDKLAFAIDGKMAAFQLPEPVVVIDKFSGEQKKVFPKSFVARYPMDGAAATPITLRIHLQGCDDANCFFPEDRVFTLKPDGTVTAADGTTPLPRTNADAPWRALADNFTVAGRGSGYLNESAFLSFLTRAESGRDDTATQSAVLPSGFLVTLVLIVLGGIGLNLTPCVLPLIPINLAIIGAGAQASSRQRGFALGATYGAGMAIAYGLLGVVVVLTGAKFGTLNSSGWFNLIIAAIFAALGLCMFDVFALDFSRFQGRIGTSTGRRGTFFVAYSMGSLAALLAGACVAPVVISVLVQATTFYNRGVTIGLTLPFLLGLGMGLPWPFAGAGLSFLPKPGIWMNRVKYGFGVLIMIMAGYYGYLACGLLWSGRASVASGSTTAVATQEQLTRTLRQAQTEGRPVFIDFWASWCKNCSAMEHTTFRSAAVQKQLSNYLQVRLDAEHPNEPPSREILDYFGAMGLPTYVVLTPKTSSKNNHI